MNTLSVKQGEVLKRGSNDARVVIIQTILGFEKPIEHFGPETEKAVIAFQKAKGLTADGKVGPVTAAALQAYAAEVTSKGIPLGTTKESFIDDEVNGLRVYYVGNDIVRTEPLSAVTQVYLPAKRLKEDTSEDSTDPGAKPEDNSTLVIVGLSVAAAALIGYAWWSMRKEKPRQESMA